jgi:hypothetical protein
MNNISKFFNFTTKVTKVSKYDELEYKNNINLTNYVQGGSNMTGTDCV